MVRLLSIGDNCIDNYVELSRRFPGGNALNVAVYSNRIQGVEADYIGVIGTDDAGNFLLDQMKSEGLSVEGVLRLQGETAVTNILIRDGERIFADYIEGIQKDATFPKSILPKLRRYDVIHYTVWGWGKEYIPVVKRTGRPHLSCDFSNQFNSEALDLMPWLDYCFFSGKDLIKQGVDIEKKLSELRNRTLGLIILTLGEHGSIVMENEKLHRGKAHSTDVVDTLGAGDSFIANFLCSHQMGDSIDEAIRKGHAAATKICSRLGGWGGN